MKKRYLLFSFILVAFVLTAQSTWAYFKDSREVKTAFSASVKSKGPYLEIANNGIFDPDHGSITLTVNYYKNSTLPWNQDTVHLEIGTPYTYIFGSNQPLNNLFGVNNSGENSYYKISGLDKPVKITSEMATFNVTVDYSNDYSKAMQIRLGVEEIRFNLIGKAESLQGERLDVQSSNNLLKIKTTPWNWPTSGTFSNNTTYRVDGYDQGKQTVTSKTYLYYTLNSSYRNNYKELHTPVYYGPSHISTDPTADAYSKNVFPSLRFIPDNIGLFDNNTLSYSEQYNRAEQYFPSLVCYAEDPNYFLIRGPIYYIPGKGFIGLYYMTWYSIYNDYGATNNVFKQLYIYNGQYKSIKFANESKEIIIGQYFDWWGNLQDRTASQYKYQLESINPIIAQYTDRFVTVDTSNPNVLKANYQDYSNLAIGASSQIRSKFQIKDDIYQGPDYVHQALGSLKGYNHVYLVDENNREIYSR